MTKTENPKVEFDVLNQALTANFARMQKDGSGLFYIAVDRDLIFTKYLEGFDTPELKQEHTCNCCRSFLRQWGGIATIIDQKVITLWDGLNIPGYEGAVKQLRDYVHSLPITDVFLSDTEKVGTVKSWDPKLQVTWKHFNLQLPKTCVVKKDDLDTKRGARRDDRAVLERSLRELTLDSADTVLELIQQGSLYKGPEFAGVVKQFRDVKAKYDKIKNTQHKDAVVWEQTLKLSGPALRIRNTAIGTLLTDLSENMELDKAVGKFEAVVAPTNYKRPTSLVTPKMVEAAREEIKELGYEDSLERRQATPRDVSAQNVLFTYRRPKVGDVFDEISKETSVDPKSLTKVEEMHVDTFFEKVLPTAKKIELLLENRLLPNMVSLIAPTHPEAPTMFKWDNGFSWSYTGGITDAIKERVKAAGGSVEGKLRASLSWSNHDDLDLHAYLPPVTHIWYGNKSAAGGRLDVDANAGYGTTRTPVENIVWADQPPKGKYRINVHNFSPREKTGIGFVVQIEFLGEVFEFASDKNIGMDIEFTLGDDGIVFKDGTTSKSVNKDKWNLRTNKFHTVRMAMLSPNFWGENKAGNKHHFFFLEKAESDEQARVIYNEFLKPELDVHRKVMEVLGSKLKVEASADQLSGVGFSTTQRNHVFARVTGKFERTVKITF